MKPLKNPRKYVERLKRENAEAWERVREQDRDITKYRGTHWFDWEDGVEKVARLSPERARHIRIESKVALYGKITDITPSEVAGEYSVTVTLDEVRIIEE